MRTKQIEEVLKKHGYEDAFGPGSDIFKAMQEYADQCLAEYKAKLKKAVIKELPLEVSLTRFNKIINLIDTTEI